MCSSLSQGNRIVPTDVQILNKSLLNIFELRSTGESELMKMTKEDFIKSLDECNLPLRDLRKLLKAVRSLTRSRFPVLLPRPSSKCYILEIEHLKLVCFKEKCLIFNPEENGTKMFISELIEQFKRGANNDYSSMVLYPGNYISIDGDQDYEIVILEIALENIVNKFRRHVKIKKPALEMLLLQIEQDTETHGLKRLLAVKNSLLEFEKRVEHVRKVVQNLLVAEEDLIQFYLTKAERTGKKQEEIKILFEGYAADLHEIETETKIFNEMIEDTDQFISAHLDSVRNEMIKLSLFIEIGALVMASGAVVSGIFGMNLLNKMEEYSYGFLSVCLGILVMMICFFAGFYQKYYKLQADTSSAHNFTLLKNFFTYIDDIEYYIFNKKPLNREEFKDAVEKITKLTISERESEYLFTMFDANKDGLIDIKDKLNLKITNTNV